MGVSFVARSAAQPDRGFRLFPNELRTFAHGSGERLWVWSPHGLGRVVWAEAPATGGGGGLVLRRPPDIFTGATLAAAQAARNAFFAANPTDLAEFQGDPFLTIGLDPTGNNNTVWQTYAAGQEGQAHDASQWLDRTGFVRGPQGIQGDPGDPADNASIDARIQSGVATAALTGDASRWALDKIPAISAIMGAIDGAIGDDWRTGGSGGGEGVSGVTRDQVADIVGQALLGYRQLARYISKTANYQIVSADRSSTVALTGNSASTFTVPTAVPTGWWCVIGNAGSAALTVSAGLTSSFAAGPANFNLQPGECVHVQFIGASTWLRMSDSILAPVGGGGGDSGESGEIPDSSITPEKFDDDTAEKRRVFRAAIEAAHIGAGTTLPTAALSNVGDVWIFPQDVSSGLSWRDISDVSAEITSAEAGDVGLYLPRSGWVRSGNILERSGRMALDTAQENRQRIEDIEPLVTDIDQIVDDVVWANAPAGDAQFSYTRGRANSAAIKLITADPNNPFNPAVQITAANFNTSGGAVLWSTARSIPADSVILVRVRRGEAGLQYRTLLGSEDNILQGYRLRASDANWDYYFGGLNDTGGDLAVAVQKRTRLFHTGFHGELFGRALDQVRNEVAPALERTQRLRPISQWLIGGGAQTLLLEWKPVGAVASGASLSVNVGGTNITGVTTSEGLPASDTQGTLLSLAVNDTNAANIDRAPNTAAGHIQIQITHAGVVDTTWMAVSPVRALNVLQEAVAATDTAGTRVVTLPANFANWRSLRVVGWEGGESNICTDTYPVAVIAAQTANRSFMGSRAHTGGNAIRYQYTLASREWSVNTNSDIDRIIYAALED